jgi:hypothetical protein
MVLKGAEDEGYPKVKYYSGSTILTLTILQKLGLPFFFLNDEPYQS